MFVYDNYVLGMFTNGHVSLYDVETGRFVTVLSQKDLINNAVVSFSAESREDVCEQPRNNISSKATVAKPIVNNMI